MSKQPRLFVDNYKPIATESLLVGNFPPIELYLRRGYDNFTLYKPDHVELKVRDTDRFKNNHIEFVYINADDSEMFNEYLEKHVRSILLRGDVKSETKEFILSIVLFNYLFEVYSQTERIGDVTRCRQIIETLSTYLFNKGCLKRSLTKILDGSFQIFAHSIDVTVLAILAHKSILDLHRDELLEVGVGAMFHDIGIIFLTSNSIKDASPATDTDYTRIKMHPQMGYNLLFPLWGKKDGVALDIVRYHQEKYDGSGYPFHLVAERIPISAQIVSICDVYSSLTTDRPFRKASTPEYALKIMESESHVFNPDYLHAFKSMILQE
ncbi:MAG: HD domain-containing phosphohydrolase [Desulfuromonadales bacterium]